MGLRVRTYCPVGDLVAGMSYLVRRLLENTSNDSFLLSRSRGADLDSLPGRPMNPFNNEPLLELRRAPVRDQLVDALDALTELPWRVPVLVGGERRDEPTLDATDPGVPDRVVAHVTVATSPDVDQAVHAAAQAAPAWEAGRARPRGDPLARRGRAAPPPPELAALAVRECAKPWHEADADVCEAIDFLEYYAVQAVALEGANGLVQLPGERNTLRYAARGVVAVVGPWNFPLAIPARDGRRRPGDRQRRRAQAGGAVAGVRVRGRRGAPRRRRARGRPELPARRGRRGGGPRRPPRRPHDRVHRLRRGRAGDPQDGRANSPPARATSSAWSPRWAGRTA